MSYAIKQERYYKNGDTENNTITKDDLIDNVVSGKTVIKLGIQAPPGTRFWVNSEPEYNRNQPVIVGITGIYEIDLTNLTYITTLKFDEASLKLIDENDLFSLIIDYIYEETEGVNL